MKSVWLKRSIFLDFFMFSAISQRVRCNNYKIWQMIVRNVLKNVTTEYIFQGIYEYVIY